MPDGRHAKSENQIQGEGLEGMNVSEDRNALKQDLAH